MTLRGGKNTLGPTLRALRKMRKLTQGELAARVGLERTSITNIELGNQPITDVLVERIASVLGYRVVVRFERVGEHE
jgi:transcriptional regulator with XRE-family HTH domain